MAHDPRSLMAKEAHPDVVAGLLSAARECVHSPHGFSAARKALVDGYKVQVAVKRLPTGDKRYYVYDRRFLVLFRVDRESAKKDKLHHDQESLSFFLAGQERAIDYLFNPEDGKPAPFDGEDFDITCEEDHHFDSKRWRCALWAAGLSFSKYFGDHYITGKKRAKSAP